MEQKLLQDILETVEFLKENMVSKDDLVDFATKEDLTRFATKDDLHMGLEELKSDLMTHMDGFISLHQKLDLELVAMRAKYDRLEGHIKVLAEHLHLKLE